MARREADQIADRIREMYRRRRSSTGERAMVPSDVDRFLRFAVAAASPSPSPGEMQ